MDENSAKSAVPSEEKRKVITRSSGSTGLYRWTRVSSHRTNLLEFSGKTWEGPLEEKSAKSPVPYGENRKLTPDL